MAQLQLIKQSPGILIPATPETSEFLQSKCKLGAVLVADFKQVRNPAFHRRFCASQSGIRILGAYRRRHIDERAQAGYRLRQIPGYVRRQ